MAAGAPILLGTRRVWAAGIAGYVAMTAVGAGRRDRAGDPAAPLQRRNGVAALQPVRPRRGGPGDAHRPRLRCVDRRGAHHAGSASPTSRSATPSTSPRSRAIFADERRGRRGGHAADRSGRSSPGRSSVAIVALGVVGLVMGGGDPARLFGADWSTGRLGGRRLDAPGRRPSSFVILVPLAYFVLPRA